MGEPRQTTRVAPLCICIPETLAAIQELFAPEPCVPGFSPASHDDFRTVETMSKGHGRIEKHVLTVSAALQDWVNWPHAAQVFKPERYTQRLRARPW